MSIEQKILNIVADVQPLEKTAYNDISKYHYTPEADVKNYIRPFLVREKLLLTYSVFQQEEASGHAKIVLGYKFTDVSTKEVLEGMWCGGAFNHSGYAIQTAITAAVKQFLLTIFHIPTYDDLEAISGCTPQKKEEKVVETSKEEQMERDVPPVVDQEKLKEKEDVTPGTKRRGRNAKKAVESVEKISEKTSTQQSFDIPEELPVRPQDPISKPSEDFSGVKGRDWKDEDGKPVEIPVEPTTEPTIEPTTEAPKEAVPTVQKKHLLDIQHMLAGLAENSIMSIEESVVSLIPPEQDIYYAHKIDPETKESKTMYAIKTPK